MDLASARAVVHATPAELRLSNVSLMLNTIKLEGALTLGAGPYAISHGVPYEFRGKMVASDWRRLRELVPDLPANIHGGQLVMDVSTKNKLPHFVDAVRGKFMLKDARVVPAGEPTKPLKVKSAGGVFVRHGDRLSLSDVRADLGDLTASGTAILEDIGGPGGARFRLNGAVSGARPNSFMRQFVKMDPAFSSRLSGGTFTIHASANGNLASGVSQVSGTLAVHNARITSPLLDIQKFSGSFETRGDDLVLSNLRLATHEFTGRGRATIARNATFRLNATLATEHLAALRRLHPAFSDFTEGSGQIRLAAGGHLTTGVSRLSGMLAVSDARLVSPALDVQSMNSPFERRGDSLVLTNLRLATRPFTGRGMATIHRNAVFALKATLKVKQLAALAELHPSFANFAKGSAQVQLEADGRMDDLDHAVWTGTVKGDNGEWKLLSGSSPISELAFQSLRSAFRFVAGKVSLTNLQLTGTQFNLVGSVERAPDGPLTGQGKAQIARNLVLQLAIGKIPQGLLDQIKQLPLEYLPLRVALKGTAEAPQLDWQLEEAVLLQLATQSFVASAIQKTLKNGFGKPKSIR